MSLLARPASPYAIEAVAEPPLTRLPFVYYSQNL
jgi:hypothetical protein